MVGRLVIDAQTDSYEFHKGYLNVSNLRSHGNCIPWLSHQFPALAHNAARTPPSKTIAQCCQNGDLWTLYTSFTSGRTGVLKVLRRQHLATSTLELLLREIYVNRCWTYRVINIADNIDANSRSGSIKTIVLMVPVSDCGWRSTVREPERR